MIESLSVKNFRCFEHIQLKGLARINVVTGSNASGKTSLLEALYIGVNATAQAINTVALMRGMVGIVAGSNMPLIMGGGAPSFPNTLAMYFDHLFRYGPSKRTGEIERGIEIKFADGDVANYELEISYQTEGGIMTGRSGTESQIVLDRKKTIENRSVSSKLHVTVNQFGQIQHELLPIFGPRIYIFNSEIGYSELDNVMWFSQLKERNDADKVISFIREEFPFITDIEILAPMGMNALYAKMANGSRLRIAAVSAGLQKIISILLCASHTNDGIIVIDEVENGIFYEKYQAVWRILYKFAKETNNQIFVSSHSAECLNELHLVIGDNQKDFRLLRTERDKDRCVVRQISGAALKAAIAGGNEIRGGTNGA